MVAQREIVLPALHESQRAIAKDPHRFRVVCCGRRWGKTLLSQVIEMRGALKGGRWWHVAPTYQQGLEGWRYLLRLVNQLPPDMTAIRSSDHLVSFATGGSIQVKTADNPDNLRGSGLDGVVLDEAAITKQEVWELILRPALSDRQGQAVFPSTPQHFNWYFDLFERGQNPDFEDWASWQLPTWDNPFIPDEEIEASRRDMTPEDFDQEYAASFTAIGGAIWPQLSRERTLYLRPRPSSIEFMRVGVGMDWGTTNEHQAAVVCDGMTKAGQVWRLSSWLSPSGNDAEWFDEAMRCRRDYGASFARYDRSQGSAKNRLEVMGYDAAPGVADVEARVGVETGLIQRKNLFWDIAGPGCRENFTHCTGYHRYPKGHTREGHIVEEEDDDVDAGAYCDAELVTPRLKLTVGEPPPQSRRRADGPQQARKWL